MNVSEKLAEGLEDICSRIDHYRNGTDLKFKEIQDEILTLKQRPGAPPVISPPAAPNPSPFLSRSSFVKTPIYWPRPDPCASP